MWPIFLNVTLITTAEPGRKGNIVKTPNRICGVFVAVVACASLVISTLEVTAEASDFQDGFEIGDVSTWSEVVGGSPITPPAALRFTGIWVRDPHFFVSVPPFMVCTDFTDGAVSGVLPSVNDILAIKIVSDDDSDGYLDLSVMLLFRPFDANAVGEIVDARSGACVLPANATSCHVNTSGPSVRSNYDGFPAGPCLPIDPGDVSGYSPGVTEPTAPCFRTAAQGLDFTVFGDQPLPLQDAQISARIDGSAPDRLIEGLIVGFLRQDDADSILIPASYPVIGGQPISILLPGGTGNCSGGDDTDFHDSSNGWWFYINFTAENVPWTGL